jgi:hypothetical protein
MADQLPARQPDQVPDQGGVPPAAELSTFFDSVKRLLEDKNVAAFFERMADRWSATRATALAAQAKAVRWHLGTKGILFLGILIAVGLLTYAGKIEGQAAVGLLGGLVGYLAGKKSDD